MTKNQSKLTRILLTLSIILFLSIASLQVFTQMIYPTYEAIEETAISKHSSMTFSNGTMLSYFDDDIEETGVGQYNLTLPTFSNQRYLELNTSVSEIRLKIFTHHELPLRPDESNPDGIQLTGGYQINVENIYSTFKYSPPRSVSLIGTHAAFAMTSTDRITLDDLSSFNASEIYITCEFLNWVEALDDFGNPSDLQNFTVLYSMGFEVIVEYQRPIYDPISSVTLILSIFGIIGLMSLFIISERKNDSVTFKNTEV